MNQGTSTDLYQRVTNAIVTAIEAGACDYQMPWNTRLCGSSPFGIPSNPVGRYSYRGINILSLWGSQEEYGFPTSEWATYQQWKSIGAQVKKGEKASISIFYKPLDSKSATADEDGSSRTDNSRPFIIKAAHVFNAAQVEGYSPTPPPPASDDEKHAASDHLICASGAKISLGGSKACYIPGRDEIHLPPTPHSSTAKPFMELPSMNSATGRDINPDAPEIWKEDSAASHTPWKN